MRILFLSRSTLFNQPGGDTLQVEQTALYLRQLGCEVEIASPNTKLDLHGFDLIHFFNLIRPADARLVFESDLPFVISSIYHDYSEYDAGHRGWVGKILFTLFGKFGVEYLKTIARWFNNSDNFPGWQFLLKGHKKCMQALLNRASWLISTSHQELQLIENELGTLPKSKKINLGSEHIVSKLSKQERQGVICAARIEGPKNQLRLIRSLEHSNIALTLFGQAAFNQSMYFEQCKAQAGSNVRFAGRVPDDQLVEEFLKSKVHALISYYETTGLSTLEALKMGCQVVITSRGAQPEIFGDHAFYCEPEDEASILEAVKKAMASTTDHKTWVESQFSWKKAATQISDIYKTVLERSTT